MLIAWLYQTGLLWLSKSFTAGGFPIRTGSSGSVKTPAITASYRYQEIADHAKGIRKTAPDKHRKGWTVFFVKRA